MEVLIALVLQATEMIQRSGGPPPWREGPLIFLSGRLVNATWLSRHPPILLNNVGHRLETAMCWFVIRNDKLNSSVQACFAGSLHDYVTLLQVHNSFLVSVMGFLILSQAYSLFLANKKKGKKKTMTRTLRNEISMTMHIISCISEFAVLFLSLCHKSIQ